MKTGIVRHGSWLMAFAVARLCIPCDALALDNGLALTPPMGWNSYNEFGGNISEALIKGMADAMVSSGMAAVGYRYVNIDEWWQSSSRDANGGLAVDRNKFPNGMKELADYVHGKGLKIGIYSDRATVTCGGMPGSQGHEVQDADTFAAWGIDYVKYDNCNATLDEQTQYETMRDAIAACGRPMVYSVCAWHFDPWMPATGNLWRTTGDIEANWSSIMSIVNQNERLAAHAGPGGWNDPDMLEVGNGSLTVAENRAHFSLWAIMAAPLIAGNDLRNMNQTITSILTNAEVIAVNQDSLGIQGTRIPTFSEQEVWTKRLRDGSVAVLLFNRGPAAAPISFEFDRAGVLSGAAYVRDLWAHADLGLIANSYSATVPSHDVVMLKVTPGPDTVAPRIVGAYVLDPFSICLYFSERLDTATARNTANYTLDCGGAVRSVSTTADRRSVVLTLLSSLDSGAACRVTVGGVTDAAGNAVAPGTGITVVYAQDGIVGVTTIRYCPRQGFENRMVGGVFEGTNGDRDSGPYQTIHTITVAPQADTWTEVTSLANNTTAFRCVRYRSPAGYCNVAEIEFYRGSVKMSGTLFGTPGSWENLGNDFTKAFDGNISTFFDSDQSSGSYTGIEWRPADPVSVRSAAVSLHGPRQRVSAVAAYDLAGRKIASLEQLRLQTRGARTVAGGVFVVRMSDGTQYQQTRQ